MPKWQGVKGDLFFGNIVVGLGMGWFIEHYWPQSHPWGYAGGVGLGLISGFWQLLKASGALDSGKKKKEKDGGAP